MIVSAQDAVKHVMKFRREEYDPRIVFTNGCFDLFHVGHLATLRTGASVGDMLIVGVNTDESVRKLKGAGRPIIPQDHRAAIVDAIQGVDLVVLFAEETPLELVRALQPNIILKCETWAHNVVGKDDSGIVILSPQVPGISTTEIIESIKPARLLEAEWLLCNLPHRDAEAHEQEQWGKRLRAFVNG